MATTRHTCGGPVFGKRTAGCPRCDELTAGAKPVVWATRDRFTAPRETRHDCRASRCLSVCTYGDY